jgi:hypothetical protein
MLIHIWAVGDCSESRVARREELPSEERGPGVRAGMPQL